MEPPRIFLSTPSARRATAVSRAASCIFFQFLSTPSARRATRCPCGLHVLSHISIHALCEEGDLPGRAYGLIYNISIHALCEEGDNPTATYESIAYNFYPRPLRGGRRIFPKRVYSNIRHFYPRPLRGGRREHFGVVSPDAISIHALCEEGDVKLGCTILFEKDFYPRPLRGGRRTGSNGRHRIRRFLSTPSARRATTAFQMPLSCGQNFYPRPLRGGRPTREYYYSGREQFLSTPSARRATPAFGTRIPKPGVFLSTPSARRATLQKQGYKRRMVISIHALCEEGDPCRWVQKPTA